jgi:hypothetical protein
VADWILCREDQLERARHAVWVLARAQASGWATSGVAEEFARIVADLAHKKDPAEFSTWPSDRLLETWVSDLTWEVRKDLAKRIPFAPCPSDDGDRPSTPKGYKGWKDVREVLQNEAQVFLRIHGLHQTDSEEFAEAALERLLDQQAHSREVRSLGAWAWKVYLSFVADAARGRADGPLPQRKELPEHVARGLRSQGETPSPEEQMERRELALVHLAQLPQPYRQIACWESLGVGYAQMVILLRKWRPIGHGVARRLIARARQMLTALPEARDLRREWPRRFLEEGSWKRGQPPPISRL